MEGDSLGLESCSYACQICMELVISNCGKEALHALATFHNYCVKCAASRVQSIHILLPGTKQLKVSWMESVKCLQICSEWYVMDCVGVLSATPCIYSVWSEIALFYAMLSPL